MNAHVVVASPEARFGLTEVRIGLWPYVIFHSVAAAVGTRKATELVLTGRILDAHEARRIGIVDWIVETEKLHEESHRLALGMAEGSADAIGPGLDFVRETLGLAPEAAAETALRYRGRALDSADFREGVLAFRQKRTPLWPSHRR
jgi:enoyl-CoA hydratase/carnithine racemase